MATLLCLLIAEEEILVGTESDFPQSVPRAVVCGLFAKSCLALSDPMNCSLPGSCVHGISPGKNTGVGCHFLPQGSSRPRDRTHISRISCTGRQVLDHQHHLGSPWDGRVHSAVFKLGNQQGPTVLAQGTLLNVMWQPGWEEGLEENGYMYVYG